MATANFTTRFHHINHLVGVNKINKIEVYIINRVELLIQHEHGEILFILCNNIWFLAMSNYNNNNTCYVTVRSLILKHYKTITVLHKLVINQLIHKINT